MTTGERIRKLRRELGMSQDELAKLTGYSDRSSIAKIESNKCDLSETKIKQFAFFLEVTPAELLGMEEPTVTKEYVTFPILGEVAAGYERYADADQFGTIDIPSGWLRGRPMTDYFVLKVSGDSMYPTYQDGDLVLVLKQSTMNYSGQVGVVMYDDDKATLKRIEYVMGEDWMRLVPINPQYPPIMVTDERLEHCRVLGLPKKLIRDINL